MPRVESLSTLKPVRSRLKATSRQCETSLPIPQALRDPGVRIPLDYYKNLVADGPTSHSTQLRCRNIISGIHLDSTLGKKYGQPTQYYCVSVVNDLQYQK
jgi:hypothetical protein